MKKQRTNNPRFLGALGFMGFLGLQGANNPEIQQWSRLAWLSLISLLVFFPTMDVNSPWQYRINPRRKWMLSFLFGLSFLAFLHTDPVGPVQLAIFFSMLAQFAIEHTHKPREHEKSRKRGVILSFMLVLAIVIMVASTALFHPMAGVLVLIVLLPTLSPFLSLIEGKDRFPIRELVPVFLLLFTAVILPSGGLIWFMSKAVKNERFAVRQRLTEVYETQLDAAVTRIEEKIASHSEMSVMFNELPPAERFDALLRGTRADSVLILDERGNIAYPQRSQSFSNAAVLEKAVSLRADVRTLLQKGLYPDALKKIEEIKGDSHLRNARDESGRLILPALQLFWLQQADVINQGVGEEIKLIAAVSSLRKTIFTSAVLSFREVVVDYSIPMTSSRRLFYLQELERFDADVEPWLKGERLAVELLDYFDERQVNTSAFSVKDFFLVFGDDSTSVAVFQSKPFFKSLQDQLDSLPVIEGVSFELSREQGNAWRSQSVSSLGDEWFINLYLAAADPFAASADQHILIYFWTGFGVIGLMSVVSGLLIRSLLTQQKMTRMKNNFVATITHELKTPLASTRMLVDTLLQGRCRDDQQRQEYLELIARENKRLSRLIDNFLTFSRMERNKKTFNFEDVDPEIITSNAADAVRESFERSGCKLTVNVAGHLPDVMADTDAMITVLINLLDNACKYSEGDKCIELRAYTKDQLICFEVADNGIGMAKRELSKVMERFYQVDQSMTRKVGGAGLGLSIVSFIVDAHGGKVDIESELGKGSVFTVKLPVDGDNHGE